MAIKRDNDEERVTRMEHILERLVESRADSRRIQARARRMLADLQNSKTRRAELVASVESLLGLASPRKAKPSRKRSR